MVRESKIRVNERLGRELSEKFSENKKFRKNVNREEGEMSIQE